MYTFREDPRGIVVISESGYEIPWGKRGTIPEEAHRLRELNADLDDDFSYWIYDMTNAERVAEKEEFFRKDVPCPTSDVFAPRATWQYSSTNELHFISTLSASTQYGIGIKKEEETMNTTRFEDTQEGKAQAHVLRRADTAYREKTSELELHYGLRGEGSPKSWEDLIKRIKDGKFVIEEKHAEMQTYDPLIYVEWRDPKIVRDEDGFNKSLGKLGKLLAETKDVIIVKSAADGLEMIEKISNFKH